jgi:hypothetical protein
LPVVDPDRGIDEPSVMACLLLGNWLKDSLWYHLLASGSALNSRTQRHRYGAAECSFYKYIALLI